MKYKLALIALLFPCSLIAQEKVKTKTKTQITVSDGKDTKTYHIGDLGDDLPSFLDELNLEGQIQDQLEAQLSGRLDLATQIQDQLEAQINGIQDMTRSHIVIGPDGNEHEMDILIGTSSKNDDHLEKLWPQIAKGLERAGIAPQTIDKAFDYAKAYASPHKKHMIGVQCRELDDVLRHQLGLEQGLVVQEVFEDSSAKEAGMKKHDILLQADGIALLSIGDLVDAVQGAGIEGSDVNLVVLRAGEKQEMAVGTQPRVSPKKLSVFGGTGDIFFSDEAEEHHSNDLHGEDPIRSLQQDLEAHDDHDEEAHDDAEHDSLQ